MLAINYPTNCKRLKQSLAPLIASHQCQEIDSEPNTAFKKQLKALENVTKQACCTSIDTAFKIIAE